MTLQEKAKIWLEAHEEDDAYINQMMSIAYKDGYKEALEWVLENAKSWEYEIGVVYTGDLFEAIEKELGE